MSYCGYVAYLKNLHKHPNADRLQIGECFGNNVIVSMEYIDNQVGIYFPSGGRLSTEYATRNNLVRMKDENGNNVGGYLDPEKRNVTAIKLRGEKSDGIFMPLSSLEYFGNTDKLKVGEKIDVFNGQLICEKYIPLKRKNTSSNQVVSNKVNKRVPFSPLFIEHADTEQLSYNLDAFHSGDLIEITLKMHGTSQRTGYLPILTRYKRSFKDFILRKKGTPIYEWGYVSGTRRTVMETFDEGYYGDNKFREKHCKFFEGKLNKGEEVYYEVVGFTDTGTPIMASADNRKLNDKEFIKKYGEVTEFSYDCSPSNTDNDNLVSDFYVYRMTMTNEDGDIVEYTPEFMRYRCQQMGCKCVPEFVTEIIPSEEELHKYNYENAGEWVKQLAEQFYDGPDPIGKTHIREGVVIRIVNKPSFTAYKHKNWYFKALSGIAIDSCDTSKMSTDMIAEL